MLFAQSNAKLYLGVGANSYSGDLGNAYSKWTPSFHTGILFNKKKRINGSINLVFGRLTGQTLDQIQDPDITPNDFFNTSFFSVNYDLQINLVKTEQWKLYLSQGVGFMFYTPKDENSNSLIDQPDTRPPGESYSSISVILPTKIGAFYFINTKFGVGAEVALNNPLTDYLDNISEWGTNDGNDNYMTARFVLVVPFPKIKASE